MASTTNPFEHGSFSLDEPEADLTRKQDNLPDPNDIAYFSKPEQWDNYTDEYLYQFEKAFRDWAIPMCDTEPWKMKKPKYRKYTMSQVMQACLGRPYNSKTDRQHMNTMKAVLTYYSSRVQNSYYSNEKKKTISKTAYSLSVQRIKQRPPYSLKLRLEWLAEQGLTPNYQNVLPYKETLTAGHARNKRTNANMEKRSELMRERYNERQRERRASQREHME